MNRYLKESWDGERFCAFFNKIWPGKHMNYGLSPESAQRGKKVTAKRLLEIPRHS